jgi:hypothetical protein
VAAALSVFLCSGSGDSKAAAARAAVDTGAVEALVRLGRMPRAAGRAALHALAGLVAAAEPSLRPSLVEAVAAAGGVEAALLQLQEPSQQDDMEDKDEDTAVCLLLMLANIWTSADECKRRLLDGGGIALVVQYFVRSSMAAWRSNGLGAAAVGLIVSMLQSGPGEVGEFSGSTCSPVRAVEAVEAGAVQALLRCLVGSGRPEDEAVQGMATRTLNAMAAALCLASPGGLRQLPEPMQGALRPAVAALAGLLRSTQLPRQCSARWAASLWRTRPWLQRLPLLALRCWPSSGPAGRGRLQRWCRLLRGCCTTWLIKATQCWLWAMQQRRQGRSVDSGTAAMYQTGSRAAAAAARRLPAPPAALQASLTASR